MEILYNVEITEETLEKNLNRLINQVYKLLPSREEGLDWERPLGNVIEELAGMQRLFFTKQTVFFSLLCKLEGLYTLVLEEDFLQFRSTIFECINLIGGLKNGSDR